MSDASVLSPAGPAAAWIAQAGWLLFGGAALIFGGVVVLMLLALGAPRRVHARRWVLGGGIVFPVVVLSALLVYGFAGSAQIGARPPPGALLVSVTGHMWWWELRYARDGADAVITANELRLPVGRPVTLGLTSADVIHSVWIPALAGKVDTVPGRVNRLVVTAERAGTWRGPCAEFCGEQHARMALQVVALPPADFDAWLQRQAQPARAPVDALQVQGRDAFVARRCAACHAVRGVSEAGSNDRGPDLTHVGSRLQLGAGTLANDRAALRAWIADVQRLKRGARMPSFGHLDAAELDALAAYLAHLQ
jgi:cytochrome c oxidase subunit 2